MIIYFCNKCKRLDIGETDEDKICMGCKSPMLSLGITSTEWNKLDENQMKRLIEDKVGVLEQAVKETPSKEEPLSVEAPKEEPFSVESTKDEPLKEEPIKEEPTKKVVTVNPVHEQKKVLSGKSITTTSRIKKTNVSPTDPFGQAGDFESGKAIVYASQKSEENVVSAKQTIGDLKKPFIIWGALALASMVFLSFNYMTITLDLVFTGKSETNYTGYYLTKCLDGDARLSGIMVIILIILNLVSLLVAIVGISGHTSDMKRLLRTVSLIEVIAYPIITIIPLFHIKVLLMDFDDTNLATTSIGAGCYLNIVVAIIMMIFFFTSFSRTLKE